jgi:hypothetical protein
MIPARAPFKGFSDYWDLVDVATPAASSTGHRRCNDMHQQLFE